MIHEIIPMRDEDESVTLETYVSTDVGVAVSGIAPRRAVLVLPGGAYSVCAHHEGEKIALNFLASGINAFVLNYSVKSKNPSMRYPMPLVDASKAMKYIRDNAKKYNVDPEHVYVLGFSAGGHLASMLGTIWHRKELYDALPDMKEGENKPNGMILCYPVIAYSSFGHKGSFHNLLGNDLPEDEYRKYSSEMNVDDRTCPAFLWHTSDDNGVPVLNSIVMAQALVKQKIPFEMHVYPHGHHGLGLPDGNGGELVTDVATWMGHAIDWVNKQ